MVLPVHCLAILLFRKWLGSFGTFYASLLSFSFLVFLLVSTLIKILVTGFFLYIDYGCWFSCLNLIDSHLVFCSDILANTGATLVAFLTPLSLYFGLEYMVREAFANRLLYLLNLFAASVIFFFFAYDFFLLIFFWECIGLFSLLLVNFYSQRIYTLKAAFKTFIFSRISDMFLFTAFLMSINTFNSCDLSIIFLQIPFFSTHYIFIGLVGVHFLSTLAFFISFGGIIKCAQFGFHVWLPDAMEAPTPASALIHSSTLVVAGVFLILRFALLFEFTPTINLLLACWGSLTLAFSSITATFQQDIKKLVAFSTVSQIGYLVCGCGFTLYEETLLYLVIHALNKAFLFILVGYLVHFFSGNTDLRFMGNSYFFSFDIAVMMLILSANLSGLPYFAGFVGKEVLILQMEIGGVFSSLIRALWLVAFIFTPIYMFLLVYNVLFGPIRRLINPLNETNDKLLNMKNFHSPFIFYSVKFSISFIIANLTTVISFLIISIILFFGETLFLILLNFEALNQGIHSSVWFNHSMHFNFSINLFSSRTFNILQNFIFIALGSSFIFLEILNENQKNESHTVLSLFILVFSFLFYAFCIAKWSFLLLSYGMVLVTFKFLKNE